MKVKTVLILAGGKATRLRERLNGSPKILSKLKTKLLDIQIEWLIKNKIKKAFILSKYKSKEIYKYINSKTFKHNIDINILKEKQYLGTGGAIKNFFLKYNINEPLLIINGDTFFSKSILNFKKKFFMHESNVMIGISKVEDISRYGEIYFQNNNFLKIVKKSFEKKEGYVFAGILIMSNNSILKLDKKIFSLEDFLLWLVKKENIKNFKFSKNFFYDIGTIEAYDKIKTRDSIEHKRNIGHWIWIIISSFL